MIIPTYSADLLWRSNEVSHKDFVIQSTERYCLYKTLSSSVLYSALLHYSHTHKDSVIKSQTLVEINCSGLEKYELNGDKNNKKTWIWKHNQYVVFGRIKIMVVL